VTEDSTQKSGPRALARGFMGVHAVCRSWTLQRGVYTPASTSAQRASCAQGMSIVYGKAAMSTTQVAHEPPCMPQACHEVSGKDVQNGDGATVAMEVKYLPSPGQSVRLDVDHRCRFAKHVDGG
jgi:hypothetical protein